MRQMRQYNRGCLILKFVCSQLLIHRTCLQLETIAESICMTDGDIHVRFDKSHLVTIGEKLYGESLELLRELVSNAYDADAEHVWIDVTPEKLTVRDDGWGMDEEGLREYFTIGSQNKKNAPVSPRFHRTRIGQFGIGKFASLSACECFRLRTQRSDFAAEIVFDKQSWASDDSWHVPFIRLAFDPDSPDGTTVTLEQLRRIFTLPEIERFIRERLPLQSPHFSILLNGKFLEPTHVAGRRFPVDAETPHGRIHGELILPNFAKEGIPGIECVVRGVVICRTTFDLDLPIISRLRGRVTADFLQITSDRSRFITDAPEYRAFVAVLYKEIRQIDRLTREMARDREQRKADDALKDTLSRMRKAIRRNPDITPSILSPTGEIDPQGQPATGMMAPQADASEGDALNAYQMTADPAGMPPSDQQSSQDVQEPPPKKIRVRNLQGKPISARRMAIGGIGITCALENCGREQPAAFTEGGIIFINTDHPLYRTQQGKGQDMLGFYLTYLLSQQVALLLSNGDVRKAFQMQERLLTDSW